jgi:hypothetical protein
VLVGTIIVFVMMYDATFVGVSWPSVACSTWWWPSCRSACSDDALRVRDHTLIRSDHDVCDFPLDGANSRVQLLA